MNVGMILDHTFPPDHRVEKEAIALIEAGYNVFLFCFQTETKGIVRELYKGIHLYKYPAKMQWIKKMRALVNTPFDIYRFYLPPKIKAFINEKNIDVLHVHDLYLFGSAFKALKNSNIPLVGDLHENYVDGLDGYRFSTTFPGNLLINRNKWRSTEKQWISKLDYAITVVENMKQRIAPFVTDPKKISVVDNAVDVEEFLNYIPNPTLTDQYKNKFVISYIGGFDYHRGIDTVVESLLYLKDLDQVVISIVGEEKNADRIHDFIKKHSLQNKVVFEGFKKMGDLQNYFKRADVGVVPHLKSVQTDNSSPNKLYQYMATQTPIISTNCNSIQHIVEKWNTGLIYESGNAEELAQKIRRIYSDLSLKKTLSENGETCVKDRYNWNYSKQELLTLYKKIEESL